MPTITPETLEVPNKTTNCSPQTHLATPSEFELVSPIKLSNFILGSVVGGQLSFVVENLPKSKPTTGCPGWWLFHRMMDHFDSAGTAIDAIVGSWTYGDNLAIVNRLTAGLNPLSLADASRQTITSAYAASRLFSRVSIAASIGSPGNYTKVRVLFEK